MSLGTIRIFLEYLDKNEKLAKEFFSSETPAEAIKIARKAGYEFTVNELKMILVKEVELSEEDLDAVSGGLMTERGHSLVDFKEVESLHDMMESIMKKVVS